VLQANPRIQESKQPEVEHELRELLQHRMSTVSLFTTIVVIIIVILDQFIDNKNCREKATTKNIQSN